jgi:hypothetical protein
MHNTGTQSEGGSFTPSYVLVRKLCWLQSRSERCEVEKILLPLSGAETLPSSPHPVTIPTEKLIYYRIIYSQSIQEDNAFIFCA